MTTTPTFWSYDITFSSDISAFGPRVGTFADNTFAIVWENETDIFGRHLNEFGSFTGGDFLSAVSGATTKTLFSPTIFQQADGRVVVNYGEVFDDSPLDRDVRWHSPDFTTPSSFSFPTEFSPFDEIFLADAPRATGGAAIAYLFTGPGDVTNLVVRFTDAIGQQASNQIFVDPSAARSEQNPVLAKLGVGANLMVVYESVNQTDFSRDIRLHTFSPDGTDLSGDVIVSAGNVNASFPDVVALEGPGFLQHVVTWQQTGGIAFRRYFGNLPLDDALLVPDSAGGFLPKVTALKDGGFIIAWTDIVGTESDGSPELDIFLRRFNEAGLTVGTTVRIDEPGDQGLFGMDIATMDDGRVVITYGSETGDATNITTLNYSILDPRENTINGDSGDNNIVARLDASTVNGFGGNDTLSAADVGDTLNGGEGDDELVSGVEGDTLNGGAGIDSAVFSSARAAYTLTNLGAGNVQVVGPDGMDTASAVEKLVFDDVTLNWQPTNGGDFNADAFGDALFRNTSNGQVATWELNGAGGFGFDNYGAANLVWQQIAADDFNADGKGDILWRNNSTGQVTTWELNGAGGISVDNYGVAGLAWQSVGAGDFNADGRGDVLFRNTTTGQVATWELNGSGGFAFDSYGAANLVWKIAGIGDFNQDGKDDILWRNTTTGQVATWELDGAGGLSVDNYGGAGLAWHIYGVGDFNADGKDDILWRNDSGQVATWELDGAGGLAFDSYGTAGSVWSIVHATDTNSDGHDDILWRNTTTGQVAAWELDGADGFSFQSYGAANLAWEVFDGNFQFV